MQWGQEVPPGGFLLGQDGGAEGVGPAKHVNIPYSYWLSKYEVDAHSVFRIEGYQAIRQTNGTQILIRWACFERGNYSIWGATVVQGPYSLVATNIAATPPVNTFNGTFISSNGFFRVGAAR